MQSITAPFLAFITAWLRAAYDGKSTTVRFIEGLLLGIATVAVKPLLLLLGLPLDMAIVFGVACGFVGVETLKSWLRRLGDKWLPREDKS